jgi:hypothetical protein
MIDDNIEGRGQAGDNIVFFRGFCWIMAPATSSLWVSDPCRSLLAGFIDDITDSELEAS